MYAIRSYYGLNSDQQGIMIQLNGNQLEKIPHNCLLKIKAVYDSLKTAEKKAVDFLLEHPGRIYSRNQLMVV